MKYLFSFIALLCAATVACDHEEAPSPPMAAQKSMGFFGVSPLSFQALAELDWRGCQDVSRYLHFIRSFPRLRKIDLSGTPVEDLAFLRESTSLNEIVLKNNATLTSIGDITHLPLKTLDLSGCYNIRDIEKINKITTLTTLNLRFTFNDYDYADVQYPPFSFLIPLVNLTRLDLSYNDSLTDLSPLVQLTNLRSLDISGCPVSDISPLQSMRLESLTFTGAPFWGYPSFEEDDIT